MSNKQHEAMGLMLAREAGEQIFIDHAGERLVITLAKVEGQRAYLGLKAPRSFEICRDNAKENPAATRKKIHKFSTSRPHQQNRSQRIR